MDTPLLALTRPFASPGATIATVAAQNMRQLIQLRWIAVAGQTLAILLVHYGLGVPLPLPQMVAIAAVLGTANLLVMLTPRQRVRDGEVMLALLLDMGALTLQLYFSGGATNPFVSLYLLQVVLGAILLPTLLAGLLVLATAAAYALLSLRYVPLALPSDLVVDAPSLFALGRWIAFAMVAALLVVFITRISRNLRARDAHVADLRQRAAEEDGIVRMGLFASGAAHELGTPLGTLSVILADWRRAPAVQASADLTAEVGEMQAEVQRCKAIVSDILHSAGQPRGEAMESVAAGAFLTAVVDQWQAAHPAPTLVRDLAGANAVTIAADPALRQAVWNLLDNSAEVSDAVRVRADAEAGELAIVVDDNGPGFAADVLALIGRPYQSTKGAGHGLGLFLATNVARRLGGRLEARNPPAGGAEVRIVLPCALSHDGAQ